ncbi:MAG: serine/threonine-protein kinase [Gemmataceae bacterium]
MTGRTVGDFHVVRPLGQGGMGTVYLARQLSLKRDVALKILRDDLAASPAALQRFQHEAEAVARVTHPNIVQVYAVGEADGLKYMALEYVEGRNLKEYLARKGPPDLPLALHLLRQVAAALQRAGEAGLVHRDIKPENILVTRKGEVKVADFGLARAFASDAPAVNLTQTGMTLGTPLYMAPEQVQGKPTDHRTDLYSFGVTAFHLLAGQPPFTGATAFEVAVQHVQNPPPSLAAVRPDLPADLVGLVHTLMAKDPAARYQTARDVLRDLARIQKGAPVTLPAGGLALSGLTGPVVVPGTPTAVNNAVTQPLASPRPAVWPQRLAAVVGALGLAALGWWLGGRLAGSPTPADAGPGLPVARLPDPVTSTRERALVARRKDRKLAADEYLTASLDLALLYLGDRRLDDADRVFAEMEQDPGDRPLPKAKLAGNRVALAGRLGRAVVLAHRDQAKESVELFGQTVVGPPRPQAAMLEQLLFDHSELAQAVGEALARDAENLAPAKLPDRLDWLRTPGGLARGPKG